MPRRPRLRGAVRQVLTAEQLWLFRVAGILVDQGWRVSVLPDTAMETVRAAVDRLEPDCILLDGAGQGDFGESWLAAAAISQRARPIPVIMFSVDARATHEAQEGTSARTRRAGFAAVLPKPFELEALLATVAGAVGRDESGR